MMRARYFLLYSIILTVSASCSQKEQAGPATVEELPQVKVGVATSMEIPQRKEYTANAEALKLNNISSSTPNRIKSINVEVGDRVSAGQELVILDSSNIDQLKFNLDQIKREYDRAVQLLEIGSGTQQSVDQLKAQLDAATSQYNNLYENTRLKSPTSGVVIAKNYDPGDMTGSAPILTVVQLTPEMKIMINVNENDLTSVKPGMPVDITFDAYPNENFVGSVYKINPSVDPQRRTFEVEVRMNNKDELIKPGMFGRVSIDMGTQNNVVVPDQAIVRQTGSGNKYIYVLKGDRVNYIKVQPGQRLGTDFEILDGISAGDTVVITGQTRLADGVQVKVQN